MKKKQICHILVQVFSGVERYMLEDEWPENEIKTILADVALSGAAHHDNQIVSFKISELAIQLSQLTVFNYTFMCDGDTWSPLVESFTDFTKKHSRMPVAAETALYQHDQKEIEIWLEALIGKDVRNVH